MPCFLAVTFKLQWPRTKSGTTAPPKARTCSALGSTGCAIGRRKGGSRRAVDRLALGLFGDAKPLREGVRELRIDYGPGYRVYFALAGHTVVLLLCGGDKRTQRTDITRTVRYWVEFQGKRR